MKKLLLASLAAGLIAVGAASATSLGITGAGAPALAVDVVGLKACQATGVDMGSWIEADSDTQPVQVWVGNVTVEGLSSDCIGHKLGLQFIKYEAGKDKQMGFVDGGTIGSTSATVNLQTLGKRIPAADVQKIVVVVEH